MRNGLYGGLMLIGISSQAAAGPPAPQAMCSVPLPARTGTNLVLVTHGWNADITWGQEMTAAIRRETVGSQWDVRLFDWREQAGNVFTSFPAESLVPAYYLGQCIGAAIAARGYAHVHLIGHSAGADLVASAAEQIKRQNEAIAVHLTQLEPYVPGLNGVWQGAGADWTDQYLTEDGLAAITPYLRWTDHALPNAHAVDISSFDPIFQVGHTWVHDWYIDTITAPEPRNRGYGWPLSLEAQGASWTAPQRYPTGTTVVLGSPADAAPVQQPAVLFRQLLDAQIEMRVTEQSPAGVTVLDEMVVLASANEPSWVKFSVDVLADVNALTFTSFFTESDGGMAAAYFNGAPVRIFEEAGTAGLPIRHYVYLDDWDAGRHELALRLDGSGSEVRLFNLALAAVDLRLPGDATADGAFDSADLVHVFQRGEYEDAAANNSVFGDGDWNSDGEFDSGDLVYVFKFGTYQAAQAVSIVPEPRPVITATAVLFFIAALQLSRRRR